MRLSKYFTDERIVLDFKTNSKSELLEKLAENLYEKSDCITSYEVLLKGITEREELANTGIGTGIAIAHSKTDVALDLAASFFRLEAPLDYGSLDRLPVDLVFVIGIPRTKTSEYLRMLSVLSYNLHSKDFTTALREASKTSEVMALLSSAER